jgi:hypothetical protein
MIKVKNKYNVGERVYLLNTRKGYNEDIFKSYLNNITEFTNVVIREFVFVDSFIIQGIQVRYHKDYLDKGDGDSRIYYIRQLLSEENLFSEFELYKTFEEAYEILKKIYEDDIKLYKIWLEVLKFNQFRGADKYSEKDL